MATSGVSLEPWSPEARDYVQARQERHYRKLAEDLGLGSDPKAAYERLSGVEMPRSFVDPRKLREEFGAEAILSKEQWIEFEHLVATAWDRFSSVQAPTAYEDPNLYRSLAMTFDQIQSPLRSKGRALQPVPLLATMASGNVSARIGE